MRLRTLALGILTLGVLLPWGSSSLAADSLSIKETVRVKVHQAILRTIDEGTIGGFYHLYDPLTGSLLRLTFMKVHSGVSKKDNFYVNCVDFQDIRGRVVDVDFVVVSDGDEMHVRHAAVHKLGVEKKPVSTLMTMHVLWVRVGPEQWAAVAQYAEDILCHWRAEKLRDANYIAVCLPRVVSLLAA